MGRRYRSSIATPNSVRTVESCGQVADFGSNSPTNKPHTQSGMARCAVAVTNVIKNSRGVLRESAANLDST